MKNKIILTVASLFLGFFLVFIFKLSDDISRKEEILVSSPNVLDVTDKIQTKALVTSENLRPEQWAQKDSSEERWSSVSIPTYAPIKEQDFVEGNFGYYRIFVPKELTTKFTQFEGEIEFSPQYVFFSHVEVYVNGVFLRTNTSHTGTGALLTIPIKVGTDNLIAIKGKIKTGDTGIKHRGKILLGKSSEIRELYTSSYKGSIVFPLIFLLSKGSVIFVFGLIYLLLNVERFFEKSLIFSICAFGEDLLVGDFFASELTINSRVYGYNILNIIAAIFLFLFLGDVAQKKYKRNTIWIGSILLALISTFAAVDILHTNKVFNFNTYLQFWNLIPICVMIYYIPKFYKTDKILVLIMVSSIVLSGMSLFSANIGLNYKMLGNLLLFFMVAYQSFALFRKEQLDREAKTIQLIEQEKDVAIGKTASLLAHDVRRPLEQAKLILDKVLNGEVSEEFVLAAKNDVNFSLSSVNNQINDIMNFTKTKSPDLHTLNFHQVLAGSIKQVMAIQKNVDLILKYDLKATHQILGDEGRLASALTNLISNAVEAIRDIGKKTSGTIRFKTEERNGNFIFRISNDGPAIPSEALEDIWKPKFTMGKVNGTGLGLSSVQKSVADHRGTISVKNVPGGVEFELSFELTQASDSYSAETFKSNSREYSYEVRTNLESNKRPLRIFVFDKDQQVHEYFRSLMKNLPFHVDLVCLNHVEVARTAIKNKRYDLYILENDTEGLKLKEGLTFAGDAVVMHTQKPMSFEELHSKAESLYLVRPRILVVDDGELTLMSWEMFHGKHNVRTAISPESALKIIEDETDFNLCVVDYYYDNSTMNGEQLAQILKQKGLKVILSSNAKLDTAFETIDKTHYEVRNLI
jgi:signal transduction histidine kinase/CheY-like chemotaxis protein